ncbi:hypothetical protein EI94DRAFT_145420 [Lactarius quietus]|nr:hypothetical protein EI94DRAFT_145420 [Lactarius quietus]
MDRPLGPRQPDKRTTATIHQLLILRPSIPILPLTPNPIRPPPPPTLPTPISSSNQVPVNPSTLHPPLRTRLGPILTTLTINNIPKLPFLPFPIINTPIFPSPTTRLSLITRPFLVRASYLLKHIRHKLTITVRPRSSRAHGVLGHHPRHNSNPNNPPTNMSRISITKMAPRAEAIATYPTSA